MAGLGTSFIEPGSAGSEPGENRDVGGDPRHRVVVSGQLRGDWQVITSEARKAYAFCQNTEAEMLPYGPDRTGEAIECAPSSACGKEPRGIHEAMA
jgi:hypothetical protein